MSMTLIEEARTGKLDPTSTAAAYAIARESSVFSFLPFFQRNDFQFSETYGTEDALATARALNEELTAGEADTADLQYSLSTFGDKESIDHRILDAKGSRGFNNKKLQKTQGVANYYNEQFIKGDQQANPREFNGLQTVMESQILGSQTLTAGANGAALSLLLLDEAIQAVRNAGIIFCSKAMARKFWAAGRDSTVAGFVNYQPNDSAVAGRGLGAAITFYNGLPIVPLAGAFNRDDILPFEETQGSSDLASSIYIARLGEEGLYGAQMGNIQSNDYGRLQNSVFHAWDIEWCAGMGIAHPLAIARIQGILDTAIVS